MSIWSWVGKWRASRGGSRTERAPGLEQLEPRLLLNGDLNGSDSLLLFPTASDSSAIIVDLDRQDDPAQEAATPLVSFEATGSRTVADSSTQVEETIALTSDLDATSQPAEVDPGPVGVLTGTDLLGAESLPIEARGPPSDGVYRQMTAVGNYAAPDSSDPTKSPDTRTQAFAGVNVQPSTAPALPGLPVLGQPASYDLRTYGYVTPVKNQGNAGSCWAFGTYGSLESSILLHGGPATDLSENHLKNYHGFDWGPTAGGNYYISEAYLSRWDGPVSEADDPYHDSDDRPSPGGPPQYYVREVLEFDSDSELKDGLMTYGAIGTVMYINTTYYNATTHTYYYNGSASANHGVTIVGWDDSKAVPGTAAGAWLIKNSWGTDWGDGGYFWLSYYDTRGANDGFAFYDAVPVSTYEKVYYWDYFGSIGSWNISYAFNRFTASAEQDLTAVQFWTMADGASYDVRVYDTFAGGALTGLLASNSGTSTYAGLHTVNLSPVHLTAGNDFYIYLHLTDGGTYPLAADWRYPGYTSSATAGAGQSYYSSDGSNWHDLTTLDSTANFSIRGLVTTTTPPEITVLGNGVSISDGDITPASADGTNFGTAPLGGAGVSRTFTVRNDGTGNLVLGPVTVPTGFTLTEGLSSNLAAGALDTFTVRLDAEVGGTKSGYIFIQNDDRDEHPFNFAITGAVVGPEIRVLGNSVSIADGDTTPEASDGTDFGIAEPGGAPISRTFTVYNEGNANLTLGWVTLPAGFTLAEGLSSGLGPGSSDSFTVRFDPATSGTKSGNLSFTTNDTDENPFNFRITARVRGQGDLDPTFGTGGIVTMDMGGGTDRGLSVAVQPDGRIVAAGYTSIGSHYVAVLRFNADGSLDTTFDGDGMLTTGFGTPQAVGHDVVVQPDGKIVVAGYVYGVANDDFAVVRYNVNGSLDTSFGTGGKVTTDLGSTGDHGYTVALQSDGKIVVAGGTGASLFALARYNTNGSLDSSFDGDGRVTTAVGSSSVAYGMALQPDGKIVVVGESGSGSYIVAVARYNADGSLDTSFDGDGWVTTAVGSPSRGRSVALQPDGKIVVAGETGSGSYNVALVRYNGNGSLDTSFDGDGQVTTAVGASSRGYGVALQSDGKVVVAGSSDGDFALVRYHGNGSLDSSFGTDGKATASLGSDAAYSVALQSDGKIVVAGESNYGIAVARFIGGAPAPEVAVLGNGISITDGDATPSAADGTSFGSVAQGGAAISRVFTVRNDGGADLTLGAVTVPTGFALSEGLSTSLAPGASDTFTVQLDTDMAGPKAGEVSFATNDPDGNPFNFRITGTVGNLALHKVVVASTSYSGLPASNATDGDLSSRWSSQFSDSEWIYVDLGSVYSVREVVLRWESGYGRGYTLQVSGDASTWSEAYSTTTGDGDVDDIALSSPASGRYVRMLGTQRATAYGYSLYELEVYGGAPGPEVTVLGNGISIVNGDSTPSVADGTTFGSVTRGGAAISRVFTVRNDGDSTLTLGTATVPTGFTLTEGLSDSLAVGASDTFTVQLDSTTLGTKSGEISFANNDPDENPFHFAITGTVSPPVVTVAVAPAAVAEDGAANLVYTFTRSVADTSALTVSFRVGGTATFATDYTQTGAAGFDAASGTVVIAANQTTAAVTVDPTADTDVEADETVILTVTTGAGYTVGTPSESTGTIQNDDGLGPNLALGRPVTASTSYSGLPASNATDGNLSTRWSSEFSDDEWIYADLGSVYMVNRVVLRWESGYGRGYRIQLSGDASGWSDVYSTTTGDGGIDDVALSAPALGRYVRMLGTQRATAFGYSLYELEVYGGPGGPEVTVLGNGLSIADGDTTPGTGDGTDFGSVVQGEATVSRTFTVRNDGSEALTLGTVTAPTGFTLTEALASNLDAGASDTFTVQLDTATLGTKSGEISFSNNDGDENPFNFAITGTVLAPAEITVLGNGIAIADGDTTPDTADGTDFGSVPQGAAGISRTFTVRNDGDVMLTLGTMTVPTGFTVTENLSASLAAGASDTFRVRLDTASVGTKTEDISFATNDSDENPFNFRITGEVLAAPEITVLGNGLSIADGDSTPSAGDGTDFGWVVLGGAAVSRAFTVRNDGSGALTLGAVAVPAGYTVTEGLSASLAPGASDTFTVQLDTATAGTKTGEISFSNDDPNENPFNFQIRGTVLGPGDLDPTFGTGGLVVTDIGPYADYGRAMALQPDGKIVVAGYSSMSINDDFAVVRYNADGSLDTSWSGDGKVTTDFDFSNETARSVAVQPDGKIVVAGYGTAGGNDDFAVVRYNADGSLDTSFDGDGKVTTAIGSGADWGRSVTLQPDGKILVVGRSGAGGVFTFALVRYNPDGSLDTSFDGDGKVTTVIGSSSQGYNVIVQPDGRIVVAGESGNDIALARYNSDGSLDTSFDGDGRATTDLGFTGDSGYDVALQPDGKIVVSGMSNYDFAVVRYNANGSLDTSFSGDGTVVTNLGASDMGLSVALQSDGKIVVGGQSSGAFAVARYNADGLLDTSFSGDGRVTTALGAGYGMALQSDGKIVVAGDSASSFAAVRYLGDAPAPEITVLGNGISIPDGDTTPGTAEGTDFGAVPQGSAALSRVFTVRNDGGAALTLGAVTVPTGFTLTEELSPSLAPGASDTFTVQLDTATAGAKTGAISFATNDPDENPFNFAISGTVELPAPEITVLGNDVSISDGAATPGTTDGTDFGTVAQGDAAVRRTFLVRNDGSEALTLGAVTVPAGYTLAEELAGSLDPGASDTFTVQLDTATPGIKSGAISFANNDADEDPFNFAITGAVLAPAEITVLGKGIVIADGDTSPDPADDTDFGSVPQGASGISRTFTVRNDGSLTLTLEAVTVPTGFTLTEGLSVSLGAGASDTFTVRLDTASVGAKIGDISFSTNDSDENPFNFGIAGIVLPAPEITVLGNGLAIADGDTTPSAGDGTAFGSVLPGEAALRRTFTVRNDGTATLTLGAVTVPTGYTVTEALAATLAAGESDTFTVQLDTATSGTKTGEISFATNDPEENPFNFQITGRVLGPGDLDPAFGTGGIVTTSFGAYSSTPWSVALQLDGKIVLAGNSSSGGPDDFALARYNTDGSLDTSFGVGGRVTTNFGTYDRGFDVALQSDGKIVVVGESLGSLIDSTYDFAVARYNTDGSLDPSFDGDGRVTTDIRSSLDQGRSVALQSDGKIVVAGNIFATADGFILVRYNADGSLDTSFDGDGKVMTPEGPSIDDAYSVAIQSDGKIVVSGVSGSDFALMRYNPDGSLDTSFGVGGKVVTDLGVGYSVALQPDGKIVVAGTGGGGFGVARYNPDGSLDPSFGVGGTVTTAVGSSSEGYGVALQSDGKIVVAGQSWNGSNRDFAVVRYNPDGSLDTSFDGDGRVTTAIGTYIDWGRAVALQSDGRIVVAGDSILVGSRDDFALVRYLGDAPATAEAAASGNGVSIPDGDTAPSLTDGTDFGSVAQGDAAISQVFTVRNEGSSTLMLGTASLPAGFTLVEGLSPSLAPGASDTFTVRLDTAVAGTKTGDVSFATNDYDENPFNFRIAGTVASGANLALSRPATASTSYPGLPASNATDGNLGSRWSSLFSDNEWLYVDLGSVLTINRVVLRWESAYGRGYKIQVSGNASTWPDVYSTTTGDGGVDDITLSSPASGRYVRMLGTQRATAFGYSLYELEVYGGGGPDITVLGNGVSIADGDTAPSAGDGTDFGSVGQGEAAVSHTFTVRNDGTATLTLAALTVPAGFTLTEGLASSLEPGASDTFTVQLDTATPGTESGAITLRNSDAHENPFDFQIAGTVLAPVPEITVLGNDVPIADGATTPGAGDGTDFGSVVQGEAAVSRTFTVRNDGSAALALGEVTVPAGYTLTEGLASSLEPGASDTFTVQLETATPGIKSGQITFSNNDSDENPFDFAIAGSVLSASEITVLGNGIAIADGDTTPGADDATNFGSVAQGAVAVSHTFTVRNDGTEALTLGAMTLPAGFTLTEGLAASLDPGLSDTFTVRLDTTVAGLKTGDISLSNNDGDEDPFNFRISGNVASDEYPVVFADAALKAAVEEALGVTDPTPADMLALTMLDAQQRNVLDLDGLEFAVNLSTLWLFGNQISDLSALSGLTGLSWLDLGDNQIGDLSALSGLTNLSNLDLFHNEVSGISALSGLTSLSYLHLGDNQIGSISALSGLTGLVRLHLFVNQISDISALSGLTNLSDLSLYVNQISDLSALSGLTSLSRLYLSGNQIEDISVLSGLTSLSTLDLTLNPIGDLTPLSDLLNLVELGLAANQIADLSILSGLTHLSRLHLSNNLITNLAPLSGLTHLSYLDVSSNQIGDISPLSGLTSLSTLYLSSNQIDDLSSLSGLTNLLDLSASYNEISDVSALSGLTNLSSLYLSSNQIDNISSLSGLTGLSYLDLSSNEITNISSLSGLTNLYLLDLRENPLNSAAYATYLPQILANNPGVTLYYDPRTPVYFADANLKAAVEEQLGVSDPTRGDMHGLTLLNAWSSGITDLTGLESATNLATLAAYSNQITDIAPLSGLTHIRILDLCFNQISDISAVSGLTTLSYLSLGSNQIGDISAVSGLTGLSELFLYSNQIADIAPLSGLTNIHSVDLAGNQISDISVVSGLTTLSYLNLASNRIHDLSAVSGLTGLKELYLGVNEITDISLLSNLTDLLYLDLSYNQIGSISPLSGLTHLLYLGVSHNQIGALSPLSGLTNLTHLLLEHNQITDLSSLSGLDNLDYLGLRQNPLNAEAYSIYLPQILANNPGITLEYDPPAPEITVVGNDVVITDGDATPSATDGTDFGAVNQGAAAVSRTFTVRNDGSADLTLEALTVPAGYTLTEALSASLAPGESDTFTMQLDTATVGTWTGEVSFATNDSDENPFDFTITGMVTAPVVPEVTVTVTPSAVVEDGATNLVYTFTRSVADSSALTVSFSVGGTATFATDYTQTGAAGFDAASGTIVIAANQTTATVTVDPTADTDVEADETVILTVTTGAGYTVGTPSESTGTIRNDDGSGNLALGRPATASTSYPGLPASKATDGNPASRWSSQFSDNEWLYVDLGSTYTITRIVLRWESAYGRGYKIQVSGNASTWSDVYSTTTGDGAVDDITLSSPASGRYVRLLGTQRATSYGYSLWEFEVYGGGVTNHAPAVSSFSKSLVQDTPLPFAAADFMGAFTDPDAGDSLQKIKITSLPAHGVLSLSGTAVTLDQEMANAQIGTLVYTPNSGYTGSDSFGWNGSDGNLYAVSAAAVNLTINAAVANLALHKPATASTSYSGLPATNTTDGNGNSRWSSLFSDSEWISVDLGSVYTIERVVLRWETAYGRGYKLQVSNDASTWSDVYSTTTGNGGVDDIPLSSPVSGRYVRMLGTQRASAYGYSLYEVEVYGGGGGAPEITVLGNGVSIADGDATASAADHTDFGSATQGGPAITRTFTVRNDGTAALTLGAVTVPTGFTLTEGLSSSLAPGTSDTFTVRLDTTTAGTKAGDLSFATNDGDEDPFNFRITGTVTAAAANLALGKTAIASTSYPGLGASNATDGNGSSRWSSQFSDSEWLYVDLGAVYTIHQVVLRWETAYGRGYQIQVSNDASTWSDVYSTTTGDGGVDAIALASPASGRYVRLLGTQRATAYGYSLWEFEVYA